MDFFFCFKLRRLVDFLPFQQGRQLWQFSVLHTKTFVKRGHPFPEGKQSSSDRVVSPPHLENVPTPLTFIALLAYSADNKLMIFFLIFSGNRIWHFMQIVSNGDNLHEMSNPVSWENWEKYFKMSSAENFIQSAKW